MQQIETAEIDVLDREEYVNNIFSLMLKASEKRKALCFAIDGDWGVGKSFVLNMLEKKLRIEQCEEGACDRFFVIRYNSWEYDYYSEPIIAIVAAMQDALIDSTIDGRLNTLKEDGLKIAVEALKSCASQVTKNKIGIDIAEIVGKGLSKESIDEYSGLKSAIKTIRESISTLSEQTTIVILLDELDRCVPEYVIKIFNRCNHLFDGLPNVQLVYSINSQQIKHSIKRIFGEETDVDSYLKKFIDNKYMLNKGQADCSFIQKYEDYFNCIPEKDRNEFSDEIVGFINSLNLDIRTIDKVMEKIQVNHSMISAEANGVLILFEIVSAFLKETYKSNLKDLLCCKEDDSVLIIKINGNVSVNEVLKEWSIEGINQNTLYNGRWRHPRHNYFGNLIECLLLTFEFDTKNYIEFYVNEEEQLFLDCKLFWKSYTMCQ